MMYPTPEEVETADCRTLAKWSRFLTSPGGDFLTGNHKTGETFEVVMEREVKILTRILARFGDMGGMTSEISKSIGWRRNDGR